MNRMFRIQNPTLRLWTAYGAILAVIQIAFGILGQIINLDAVTYELISLGGYLFLSLLAARRASLRTGKLSTGVVAGVMVAFIGSFLIALLSFILTLANLDGYRQSYQKLANLEKLNIQITNAYVISNTIMSSLYSIAFVVLIGAIAGLVGAFLGRRMARLSPAQSAPVEYEEEMFVPPPVEESPTE